MILSILLFAASIILQGWLIRNGRVLGMWYNAKTSIGFASLSGIPLFIATGTLANYQGLFANDFGIHAIVQLGIMAAFILYVWSAVQSSSQRLLTPWLPIAMVIVQCVFFVCATLLPVLPS
jgi:hypothetical protein